MSRSDNDREQPRLFNPARYSPVSVAIWQKLPPSNARAFAIASALGSIRDGSGSSDNLRAGKDAAGVLVTPKRLPAILVAIGINRRQWRSHVRDWEERYVAHRCDRGSVCLFTRPTLLDCPVCNERIEIDHMPPPRKGKQAPRGFSNGSDPVIEAAVLLPQSGANTAVAAAQTLPLSERESGTPKNRFHLGLDKGVEVQLQGLEEKELLAGASQVKRSRKRNEDGAA